MHTLNDKGTSRITNELIYEVCTCIRVGVPKLVAAKSVGISERNFYKWMDFGSSEFHQNDCINCDYALFFREIEKAYAQAISLFFAAIQDAALKGDWRASAWWLEFMGIKNDDYEERLKSKDITPKLTPEQFHKAYKKLEIMISDIQSRRTENKLNPS